MRGMFPGPCSFFSPICHSWWYQQKNLGTSLTQPTYPLPLQPSLWPESFSEETEEDSCTSFSRVSLSISSLLLALWDRNGLCLSRGECTYIYILLSSWYFYSSLFLFPCRAILHGCYSTGPGAMRYLSNHNAFKRRVTRYFYVGKDKTMVMVHITLIRIILRLLLSFHSPTPHPLVQ